jgi:AraC-like DNA-binding protein
MTPQSSTSQTTASIVWPRPDLATCVFCMLVRDTRGDTLEPLQRFNFFPASPMCCITWVLAGDLHLITQPEHMQRPWTAPKAPRLTASGAQVGPLVSWNPGETFAITLCCYPDAFAAVTGLDLSAFAGRAVPAEEVLPERLLAACRSFHDAVLRDGLTASLLALEDELEVRWSSARPAGSEPMHWLQDWSRNLVARAALSAPGRSARQVARRVKALTGVSKRDLNSLAHTEQLYAHIHKAMQEGQLDWAELAASSGFADQAHMIKRLRRHTGFTPQQLGRHAANDEAFWAYRLLGQYFSQATDEGKRTATEMNGG